MTEAAIHATAAMIVALKRAPEAEHIDILACLIKTWLERERSHDYRRIWNAARRTG